VAKPKPADERTQQLPDATARWFTLETDPGIVVPVLLLTPKGAKGKPPVVVMVAQAGKAGFLKERGEAVTAFLNAGVAVCLADVRGTGETKPGSTADRGSNRTTVSQQSLILGRPVLGSQLRDLRSLVGWLRAQNTIDGGRIAVWGDSFARVNAADVRLAVPQDVEGPAVSEPGGANLALLAGLFEEGVKAVYARGGLAPDGSVFAGPYLYLPHDAVVPAPVQVVDSVLPVLTKRGTVLFDGPVDAQNRKKGEPRSPADAAKWVIEKLK
jgi:hypothetical protein